MQPAQGLATVRPLPESQAVLATAETAARLAAELAAEPPVQTAETQVPATTQIEGDSFAAPATVAPAHPPAPASELPMQQQAALQLVAQLERLAKAAGVSQDAVCGGKCCS